MVSFLSSPLSPMCNAIESMSTSIASALIIVGALRAAC
jgi:hypothetical protein